MRDAALTWPAPPRGTRRIAVSGTAALPLLALLALYVPTLVRLAAGYWDKEDGAYAPLILGAAAMLAVRARPRLAPPDRFATVVGCAGFLAGLLVLLAGRLLGNMTLEAGSAVPVLGGLLLALGGWGALRGQAYPLALVLVSVPLPGSAVVGLTFPLKMAVSRAAAGLLALIGLPVARVGVVLDVGDYRLLVADACSGLQSLFSLTASVLVYLALTGRRRAASAAALIAAILPIAFAANVIRVLVLALVTVFMGERVAQGFLHGVAGMLMFAVAFAGLMLVDAALGRRRPRIAA